MAQITITVGLPREVWEKAVELAGPGMSKSAVARLVFGEWVAQRELLEHAQILKPSELPQGPGTYRGPVDREERRPVAYKWERPG